MTIYRFRITFEDYDVVREIEIRSIQTFEDLHRAIHLAFQYAPEVSSSFYISNDQWIKGTEITFLPDEKKKDKGVALMKDSRLSNFIEDPHQKFYYISNFDRPFDFHVELVKLLNQPENAVLYPQTVRSSGEPPKQFLQFVKPIDKPAPSPKAKRPVSAVLPPPEPSPLHQEDLEEPEKDLDDEEDEEETESPFTAEAVEDIEEEDRKGLREKMIGAKEHDLDEFEIESEDPDDEFGDYDTDNHDDQEDRSLGKDDY